MKIFTLNFQGIRPDCEQTKYKIPTLNEEIHSSEEFIPFFSITETHLKNIHFDAEIAIEEYEVYRSDRKDRKQGGVAVYVHNSITVNKVEKYSDGYCEAVMIYIKKAKLYITSIYRPPMSPEESFKECMKKVKSFTDKQTECDHIMLGDFNFRFLNWNTETISTDGISSAETRQAEYFLNYTNTNLLTQVVDEATRKDSVLDLVLTTNSDIIHNTETEQILKSDHKMVKCDIIHTGLQRDKVEKVENKEKKPLDKLNIQKANWEEINKELSEVNWDSILDKSKSIDEIYSIFEKEVTEKCSKHCPQRQLGDRKISFIPEERRGLIRKKKKLNASINYYKYIKPVGTDMKLKKVQLEKENIEAKINESHRKERERREIEAISKIKENPKAFYTYIKKFNKTASKVGPLADKNSKIQSGAKEKADILQDQYCKVFSNPDDADINKLPMGEKENGPNIEDINFTVEDIKTAIDDIPIFSAPGPDKLQAIILKKCKDQLAYPLYIIWRHSLDTGCIPQSLKIQSIIPIFKKKGDKSNPANYRPVSLTSHVLKLFERVMRLKIVKYLEENNLLSDDQHGFRQYRSTVTQLLAHIDNIIQILETSDNADVIYLDFAKAFDKVDHTILLMKIEKLGIKGKIKAWIKNFLSDRTQQVVVDGETSKSAPVISGVPQGTVLGPVLFIIFIDNLTEAIKNAGIKVFADDSKLTLKIKSQEDHNKLQKDLDTSIIWSLLNNMQLNTDKFQLLQHGKNNELKKPYETENDTALNSSESVLDLGITISKDLSWEENITNNVKSGKRYAGWILRCFKSRKPEIIMLLFKMFVIPRIEYASPVWMPYLKKDIIRLEALQRTVTSKLENMQDQNYHQRLKTLKLYSLQRRRERFSIITMHKMALGLTKNFLNLSFYDTKRFGKRCRVKLSKASGHIKTVRNNYFTAIGPTLYNAVPKHVKVKTTMTSFKTSLDKWLQNIPDEPPLPNYNCINSNSIKDWVSAGNLPHVDEDVEVAEDAVTSYEGGADHPDTS